MYFPVSALLIEFMILSIVNREDSYGYEISQTIKLVADIKESTLLYNWEYHKKTGYNWWILRMKQCMKLYDKVRIDHFRGFDEFWAVLRG